MRAIILGLFIAGCSSTAIEHPVVVYDTGSYDVWTPDLGATYPDSAPSCQAYCISFGKDFACNQSEKDCVLAGELIDSGSERTLWEIQCRMQHDTCNEQCVASCLNCNTNNCCNLTASDCEVACMGELIRRIVERN
jgi:hypothetical protein